MHPVPTGHSGGLLDEVVSGAEEDVACLWLQRLDSGDDDGIDISGFFR
jgi:hypothetical protein